MHSKHHKTDARILARYDAAKRRNLHLKYIPLKGRKKSRSEPALTKSGVNTECHKTSRNKVKKDSVANYHVAKKHPELLQKYPDIKKSPIVSKNPIIKLKTNDKLKMVSARLETKRASTKRQQKITPCTKQGGFTEKIVSMWHYAKSFLGLSKSDRQNTRKHCIEVQKSKHSLPVKPKRAIYVVKKPLTHHNYRDLRESKNISINQRYHRNEQIIKGRKVLADEIKTPFLSPVSKINKVNSNLDLLYENKCTVNKKEQMEVGKQIVLKDISKKAKTFGINTNRPLQHENKLNVNVKDHEAHFKAEKQVVLKDKLTKDKTVKIKSLQHENKSTANQVELKNHVLKKIPKKDVTQEVDTYQSLQHKIDAEDNKKDQIETKKSIVLKNKPKKDTTVELNTDQPFQCNVIVKPNEKRPTEEKKQTGLKDKVKKDITGEKSTNQDLQYENKNDANVKTNEKEQIISKDKPKKDIQIETNTNQHENTSKVNIKPIEKEQIEADKQMVLKDKPIKDITLEINTNRPLHEILTKANCYKSTVEGTNATIIIEIKNASSNVPKDTKQMQPQTLNVNCAIETLDVHKNAENCDKNVLTLLNTCNVKQNNITQLITRGQTKVPKNAKKPSSKVLKNQPLVKELKKYRKTHGHEYTKRCVRHRPSKRDHHHLTKYIHKHGCRYHKIKHTKRRCSTCRGYISTDDSQQGKNHHKHDEDKYDIKERCHVCRKRVSCLYHHNKKNHNHNGNHHEKMSIRYKHDKKPKSSKKLPTQMKSRSFHYIQKKKRTLTVCTNSRRNSFKNKKLKRSVTYISSQLKPSTSKISPNNNSSKSNFSIPFAYVNFKRSDSSIFRTDSDSDSDSDRQEATKVLSWWYLHYALNAVRQNPNDEIPTQSEDTEENCPFHIPYGEFCNVYEAVSKVSIDSDDSSINENIEATTNFPKHPNSFTEEEIMISENIYPNSSFYSSMHNIEDFNIYEDDSNITNKASLPYQEITTNTPQKSTIDLQTTHHN